MNWEVFWQAMAEQRLADLWLNSPNRQEITEAADEIDRLLRRDPLNQGESRDPPQRILFVASLCVLYRVDEAAHAVYVMLVDRIRR
jgi:hypothetical protein